MMRLLVVALFFVSSLLGCSGSDTNANRDFEVFQLVDELGSPGEESYSLNSLNLQSVTRMQAETQLLNHKDPLHFQLRAQFIDSGSMLAVNAFTRNLMLNDGVRLELRPNDRKIDVYLYTRDYPLFLFCSIENALTEDLQFHLRVQFYDLRGYGPAVLVWNTYNDGKNRTKKNFEFFDSSNADCNSREQVFIDHFGMGRIWGLEIQKTRLFEVKRTEHLL